MPRQEKINVTELEIRKITGFDKPSLTGFKSYEPELVDFLIQDALDNQDRQMSVTYLWFLKSTKELVGYVTVLADAISLHGHLKKRFRQQGVLYKSLPAFKIGRLCVADKYLGRGVGTLMIEFVIVLAYRVGKGVGVRFITTDAKRSANTGRDSLHFYKKFGFEVLKQRKKGTTPMYRDLIKK
jgi:GNAT superfamily N-acetyltransferase